MFNDTPKPEFAFSFEFSAKGGRWKGKRSSNSESDIRKEFKAFIKEQEGSIDFIQLTDKEGNVLDYIGPTEKE